jgi:nucleoside-diphosphate-sugar epimerase
MEFTDGAGEYSVLWDGMAYLILGAGFTGSRVVALLAARGERPIASVRSVGDRAALVAEGVELIRLDADDPASRHDLARRVEEMGEPLRALVAFPPARLPDGSERTAAVLEALRAHVARVVMISSTTVYGKVVQVDETTVAAPEGEKERLYLDTERAVREGPWRGLVLRATAIYGPGRGVLAEGGPRFAQARSMDAVISRIHADDLAAVSAAALASDLVGTYPVSDEEPASGRTLLATWAGEPWTPPVGRPDPEGSRRVDGRAILAALGVTLRYPSFRDAIK